MPSAKLKRTKKKGGVRGLQQRVDSLGKDIRVGIPRGAGNYPNGTKIEDAVQYNVLGTSRIPARNFYKKYIETHIKYGGGGFNIPTLMGNLTSDVLNARMSTSSALSVLGRKSLELLKITVAKFDTPRNAISTIRKKGFNNPLVHTGKLLDTLKWWVFRGKR